MDDLLELEEEEVVDEELAEVPEETRELTLKEEDREKLSQYFVEEIGATLADQTEQREKWEKWARIYNGEPMTANKTFPWQGASNLVVNLAAIYVDSIVARIQQGVFQIEPHWVIKGLNEATEAIAKPLEKFMDWSRKNAWDQYRAIKPMVLEMVKFGTGIVGTGWKDTEFRRYDVQANMTVVSGKKIGPTAFWVPRSDFLIPTGFNRINDDEAGTKAPWVARRMWYSKAALETEKFTGYFATSTEEEWDNVLKNPSEPSETMERRTQQQGQTIQPASSDNKMGGMWSIWQVWFQFDLDGDGYPEEYVIAFHLESGTIVRFAPNPYINGMRPFSSCPFVEKEGCFDGIGVCEMVEQYQAEVSTIHNQRRDNSTIANTVVLAARRGASINEKTTIHPGKILITQSPKEDIHQLSMGHNTQGNIQEEQTTIGLAERRVGISDVNLGQDSSPLGRMAATTAMALLQEGSRRFDLNTSELRRALGEEGIQILEMYQAHGVPEPQDPGSPEQVLGPEEGAMVRAFLGMQDNIRGVIGLELNVATAAVNREVEKQSVLQLFQVVVEYFERIMQVMQIALNPQMPPAMQQMAISMAEGTDKLMKRIFEANQTYDLDSLLMGEQLRGMMPPMLPPPQAMGAMQGVANNVSAAESGAPIQ